MTKIHYLMILRPMNCLIASLGVFIGFSLSIGIIAFLLNPVLLLAMIAVFLICGAGQTINDFFDFEIDKQSTKKRILTQGLIKKQNAFNYSIALFIIGIAIAYTIGLTQFIIAIIFSLLLFIYSWKLKNYKYIGNLIIALATSFTIIFGASIIGNYQLPLILAFSAFFANLSRELIKDIEDLKIDKDFKKTLALIIPLNGVKTLAALFAIGAIIVGFIPYYLNLLTNIYYLFFLGLTALAFVYSFKDMFQENYRKSHNWLKLGMFLALIAFLAGLI